MFGSAIALVLAAGSDGLPGFFASFGTVAWMICAQQALGGYLVAFALKYADAVAKSFATALGLVSSAVLSATWLGYAPSPMLLAGVTGVVGGTLLYVRASRASAPPPPLPPSPSSPEGP